MSVMKSKTFTARPCRATYIIFAVIGSIPVLVGVFAMLSTTSRIWKDVVTLTLLPVALLVWVHFHQIEIANDVLSYKSLFGGSRSVPLRAIRNAELKFGMDAPFGPFYRLIVHGTEETTPRPIVVNIKLFAKDDVNRLFDALGTKLNGKRRFSVFDPK